MTSQDQLQTAQRRIRIFRWRAGGDEGCGHTSRCQHKKQRTLLHTGVDGMDEVVGGLGGCGRVVNWVGTRFGLLW